MLVVLAAWAAFCILGPAGYAYTAALRGIGLPISSPCAGALSVGAFIAWCLLRTFRAGACAWTVALSSRALELHAVCALLFGCALLLRASCCRWLPLSVPAGAYLVALVVLPSLLGDGDGPRHALGSAVGGGPARRRIAAFGLHRGADVANASRAHVAALRPNGATSHIVLGGAWEARAWLPRGTGGDSELRSRQRMHIWSDGRVEGGGELGYGAAQIGDSAVEGGSRHVTASGARFTLSGRYEATCLAFTKRYAAEPGGGLGDALGGALVAQPAHADPVQPLSRDPPTFIDFDGCVSTETVELAGAPAALAHDTTFGTGVGAGAGVRVTGTFRNRATDAIGRFELRLLSADGEPRAPSSHRARPPPRGAVDVARAREHSARQSARAAAGARAPAGVDDGESDAAALAWYQLLREPSTGGGRGAKRRSVGTLVGSLGVRAVVAGLFVAFACALAGLAVLLCALLAHSGADEPPLGERA